MKNQQKYLQPKKKCQQVFPRASKARRGIAEYFQPAVLRLALPCFKFLHATEQPEKQQPAIEKTMKDTGSRDSLCHASNYFMLQETTTKQQPHKQQTDNDNLTNEGHRAIPQQQQQRSALPVHTGSNKHT